MNPTFKTYMNWSSGKDASLALYHLLQDPRIRIDKLITSVNAFHDRVSMHGLRRELLQQQAQEIGIPLSILELPQEPSMEIYNQKMEDMLGALAQEGYSQCGFGDIFLQDLRTYREKQLQTFHIQAQFPLWKRNTKELIQEFLDLGFKAILICTKSSLLDESFVGRIIDTDFLKDLPPNVDPCGENGEFHTFCFDGPIFKHPIPFELGEKVYREYKNPDQTNTNKNSSQLGFWFLDLIPKK